MCIRDRSNDMLFKILFNNESSKSKNQKSGTPREDSFRKHSLLETHRYKEFEVRKSLDSFRMDENREGEMSFTAEERKPLGEGKSSSKQGKCKQLKELKIDEINACTTGQAITTPNFGSPFLHQKNLITSIALNKKETQKKRRSYSTLDKENIGASPTGVNPSKRDIVDRDSLSATQRLKVNRKK
eukprot:TRINITY_DN4558_c0_g1_i4.p1 TRINITY_DN4558_c0_g1~~TRINITY_DN4558_c0_g1_i4.p1  ORF type:complete len:210 (+),score=41.89 TRINITY_DN4558_c0_g1_i4:78-632(+)